MKIECVAKKGTGSLGSANIQLFEQRVQAELNADFSLLCIRAKRKEDNHKYK